MPGAPVPSPSQIVDEFYELDRQVKAFAPKAKRHEALSREIRSWYDGHPADQDAVAEGLVSQVMISARGEERSLGLKAKLKIFSLIGKVDFVALVNITLKAAGTAAGEATVEKLATKERTGSRKLVAVAKQAAQRAA